jgi:dTDP-4-amino-4,6-dideoxygalactose transaminase
MNWKVPFFDLNLGEAEKEAVVQVLDSNWLTMGAEIERLETAFSQSFGVENGCAVAVTNGTAALHLALLAHNIGPGDEVICPSLTFVADANVILHAGAEPVLADVISADDWTICPDEIERKITDKTKAIIVVHYGGYPCHMEKILELAEKNKIVIIEDACHGPLSEWRGQKLGTIGDAGCFSFFSNKNMTSGEGGMVITKSPNIADRARILRSHGMTTSSFERFKGHAFGYDVTEIGYNYRLDEIRAAIATTQLEKLPAANLKRASITRTYRNLIATRLPDISVPFANQNGNLAHHIFPVLLPENGPQRNDVMEALKEKGVQTSIHYRPIHTFSVYNNRTLNLPITESVMNRILTLPLFPTMSEEQVDYVVESLRDCLKE